MLPGYPGIFKKTDPRYYNYWKVKEIVNGLGINLIDLSEQMFERAEEPKIFFPNKIANHYNENG